MIREALVKIGRTVPLAVVALALGVAAASLGCASPTQPPGPSTAPVASPSASASTTIGRTETDWGPIWDALPPGFPTYPGSRPTDVGDGPASAVLDVPADAPTVMNWHRAALERMGFRTVAVSGPAEDGSRQIDSIGPTPECAVRMTVAPLGGSTIVTILYGAGCPPE